MNINTFSPFELLYFYLCELGDEGLNHLSNILLNKLNYFLFNNNILLEEDKYLQKTIKGWNKLNKYVIFKKNEGQILL